MPCRGRIMARRPLPPPPPRPSFMTLPPALTPGDLPDAPLPVTLEIDPAVANALRNLEQAIFQAYASTPFRADAFNLLLDLQAALHLGTTRASLVVRPKD